MHPNLSHFILDVMNDVVQFQKHGHLNDSVVLLAQLFQFSVDVLNEFFVSLKMYGLDGSIHDIGFSGLDVMDCVDVQINTKTSLYQVHRSGFWVCFSVDFLQFSDGVVGIHLCGGQAAMPQ